MRRDSESLGPHREDLCPCGAKRRARSCHRKRDGTWRADHLCLLPPEAGRTGLAVRGCYASALDDCQGRLTREHYLSADVLRAVADLKIAGLPWQADSTEPTRVGLQSLVAKILCERHNHALSALDVEAGRVFRAIRQFQREQDTLDAAETDSFGLASGPAFELWMLKTLLGLWAAKQLRAGRPGDHAVPALPSGEWMAILFQGRPWPPGSGLCLLGVRDVFFRARDIELSALTHEHDGEDVIDGLLVAFHHVTFHLALHPDPNQLPEDIEVVPRPGGILLQSAAGRGHKLLALGWPDDGERHRVGTLLRPQQRDLPKSQDA